KASMLLNHGILPIVCVGETLEEREADRTFDVLRTQLAGSLAAVPQERASEIVIAYEPVWAIGTGKTASSDDAQAAHAAIRTVLVSILGDAHAQAIRIIYGGSMKPANAAELMAQPDIDGGLIGGASLKAEDFTAIVDAARA
ncbi:MAG: triosephosphate isomerase, partial [Phycisphaerales bacterium]|nr:triosephosphate isomerase [Phycisphaerales bacterium]